MANEVLTGVRDRILLITLNRPGAVNASGGALGQGVVAVSTQLIRETTGVTEAEFWEMEKPPVAKDFTSEDAKESLGAFAETRASKWSGR